MLLNKPNIILKTVNYEQGSVFELSVSFSFFLSFPLCSCNILGRNRKRSEQLWCVVDVDVPRAIVGLRLLLGFNVWFSPIMITSVTTESYIKKQIKTIFSVDRDIYRSIINKELIYVTLMLSCSNLRAEKLIQDKETKKERKNVLLLFKPCQILNQWCFWAD